MGILHIREFSKVSLDDDDVEDLGRLLKIADSPFKF